MGPGSLPAMSQMTRSADGQVRPRHGQGVRHQRTHHGARPGHVRGCL